MASNEIEALDPAATVGKITRNTPSRALNRRHFVAGLGLAGAAAGTGLVSGRAAFAQQPVGARFSQTDYLNFLLNLKYLQATFYSFITQAADLPPSITVGSGVVNDIPGNSISAGNPGVVTYTPTKVTFTGTNAQQTTDLLNEMYYDELNQVRALQNLIGPVFVNRPSLNLLGTGSLPGSTAATYSITPLRALAIARLLEDVSVTAMTGIAAFLSGSNLTYASQILAVESFHAGAIRLVAIQNAVPYQATTSLSFNASTISGSPVMNVLFSSVIPTVGAVAAGPGIPTNATIVAIKGANTSITGNTTSAGTTVTAVSSITGLAVGQFISGTNIPPLTTITAIGSTAPFTLTLSVGANAAGTASTLAVGTGSVTISANATASGNVSVVVITADSQDVEPNDPGTALASAGPSAIPGSLPTVYQGFFDTSGSATASGSVPAGFAFTRTTSQVLSILYSSAPGGVSAAPGVSSGGFFPGGISGTLNVV